MRKKTRPEKQEANEETSSAGLPTDKLTLSIPDQGWLEKLEGQVKSNIGNFNMTVDFLADELYINRAQFFRRLQALTGSTPLQYIQEIKLDYARQMLEDRSTNSVKTVAYAIGIKKVPYFSEKFKERFGKSPSEYLFYLSDSTPPFFIFFHWHLVQALLISSVFFTYEIFKGYQLDNSGLYLTIGYYK